MFSTCPFILLSVRPSVRSSVAKIVNKIFDEMIETILLLIGTSSSRGKGMKRSTLEVRRSHEAGGRLGGLAEASVSTPLGGVDFLLL